jgi:tRNA-uridine 2-sulfurtransferase
MSCNLDIRNLPESLTTTVSELGESTRPLVAVGMSGGVDSSTVAALLQQDGFRVVGLTMQLWDQRRNSAHSTAAPEKIEGRCCSGSDAYDARRVAEHLGLPYYMLNFQSRFEESVIKPFVAEYLAGRTPIPCTLCNNHVKFEDLTRTARQIGADYLATGHYARVQYDESRGRHLLLRAADESKDQTYFLFGLTQEQLSRTLFPLGSLRKAEVRAIAARNALPVAQKPESQEICFIPEGDYSRFINRYSNQAEGSATDRSGEIVNKDGRAMATHSGVENFTVGQRKGLGIATGTPLYVISLDAASKEVQVGNEAELYSRTCAVRDVNWIAYAQPPSQFRATVKIRHQHQAAPATIRVVDSEPRVSIDFDEPQRAITPGQAAVFYDGDIVLGGGWITAANS